MWDESTCYKNASLALRIFSLSLPLRSRSGHVQKDAAEKVHRLVVAGSPGVAILEILSVFGSSRWNEARAGEE